VGFLLLTTGSCARNSGRKCRRTGRFFNDSSMFALSAEMSLLLLDLLKLLSLVFSLVMLRLKKKPCARAPGPYNRSTRCWIKDFSLLDEVFSTWLSTSTDEPFRILLSLNDAPETIKKNKKTLLHNSYKNMTPKVSGFLESCFDNVRKIKNKIYNSN